MHGQFIMAVRLIGSLRNVSIPDCGSHITYCRRKCDYRLPSESEVALAFKDIISYTDMQVTHTHTHCIQVYVIFKYMCMVTKRDRTGSAL